MKITVEDPAQTYCIRLVEAHWDEMGLLYGDLGPCRYTAADVTGEGCVFIIGWDKDDAIACGGLRPFGPLTAEVKRVYVAPSARSQGVARRIMIELESMAKQMGYQSLTLETGTLQPHAVRLYEKLGYHRIPAYGEYADDPRSVCFSKDIV